MNIKCADIANYMEQIAPLRLAEDWDNVGLLVGSMNQTVKKVLVSLDVTEEVVDEAIERKADLIVSHHPVIFKGMKRINEEDPKGKIIYKLIKHGIGVYSAHTNLDAASDGIDNHLAGMLGLKDIKNIKKYKAEKLFKLVVFIPEGSVEKVRDAISSAGAGWIGNYSDCTFMSSGQGTFKPLEGTNPFIGSKGILEKVEEYRLETIVPEGRLKKAIKAMKEAHPYEEVAYDVYQLELNGTEFGFGKVGFLEKPTDLEAFIGLVKAKLKIDKLRVIGTTKKEISKVAVFCGSFDDDYSSVIRAGADILLTGDIKYHTALDMAQAGMCVVDAGHFNTERIMVPKMANALSSQFKDIEVFGSMVEKDPITFT